MQTVYPKIFICFSSLVAFIILFSIKKFSVRKSKILAIIASSLLLTNFINLDMHFSIVIMILLLVFSAVIFSEVYTRSEFEEMYAELMIFLAAISIIFYIIGILFPGFVRSLPVFHGISGDYPTVIGGVFYYPCGSNFYLSTLYRNNGPFREMGLFAMLLVWTLCIMLQKKNENRFSLRKIIIVTAALITTFSTTGLVSLAILLPIIVKKCGTKGPFWKKRALKYIIYVLGSGLFVVVIYQNRLLLFGKLNPANADYISFLERYTGLIKDISLFISYPWGTGPTRYISEGAGGANSISYFLACFGLGTTLLIFVGFFLFIKNLDYSRKDKFLILGAAMLVLMTQGVSDYIVFYMFVIYGYVGHKNILIKENKQRIEKNRSALLSIQGI